MLQHSAWGGGGGGELDYLRRLKDRRNVADGIEMVNVSTILSLIVANALVVY